MDLGLEKARCAAGHTAPNQTTAGERARRHQSPREPRQATEPKVAEFYSNSATDQQQSRHPTAYLASHGCNSTRAIQCSSNMRPSGCLIQSATPRLLTSRRGIAETRETMTEDITFHVAPLSSAAY